MTDIEKLRANAEIVVQNFSPLSNVGTFGFNQESMAWMDGFIERQRTAFSSDEIDGVIDMISCFLGECIIHCHGGEWRRDEVG